MHLRNNGGPTAKTSRIVNLGSKKLRGYQIENTFLTQVELVNVLTWDPISGPNVLRYELFRNRKRIDVLAVGGPARYEDHSRDCHRSDRYRLVAVLSDGQRLNYGSVTLPK